MRSDGQRKGGETGVESTYNEDIDRQALLHTLEHSLAFLGCVRGFESARDFQRRRRPKITLEESKDGIGVAVVEGNTAELLLDEGALGTSLVVCGKRRKSVLVRRQTVRAKTYSGRSEGRRVSSPCRDHQ